MIWFIFWLAFTLFIVWLFAQSLRTVIRQQKAWAMFARKHNLLYQRPLWYKAPSLDSVIKGRRIRLYVDEALDPVRRVREFRTTIELYFNTPFPTGLAIGSRAYNDMLGAIENVEIIRLPPESEFTNLITLGRDPGIAMTYIQEHLAPLKEFFSIPRSERLLMAHETDGFLILQTGDALSDVKSLNDTVKKLFGLMERLEPEGDARALPTPEIETETLAVDAAADEDRPAETGAEDNSNKVMKDETDI